MVRFTIPRNNLTNRTPRYIFDAMDKRFLFTLDGCASKENSLCQKYIDEAMDIRKADTINSIKNERIWMNPPHNNIVHFIDSAIKLSEYRDCLVVMLLPADKSTKWFVKAVSYASEVIDVIGGRINFLHPTEDIEVNQPPTGGCVLKHGSCMDYI